MKKKYDYLIVGAGLYGSTFAHLASKTGKKCLVIDKRPHIGGNTYCEKIEGINVHKYGAHIFHTSDKNIWDFVNSFVPFNRYTNSPIALAPDGNLYNLPFNMNTFSKLWNIKTPVEAYNIISKQRADAIKRIYRNDITAQPQNLEEQALSLVGRDLYELLIKGYTEKQWGRKCTELPPFIIQRIPLRFSFNNNYFNDLYQGIPVGGYNQLIEKMLKGNDVELNCDFFADRNFMENSAEKIVFTGKIDEYFNYCFGQLEYRSVRFENEIINTPNYQGNAVINYTAKEVPYTRIIEHKHFECFGDSIYENPHTVISREYSTEWHEGMEPFYPINNQRNQELYSKYKALANEHSNIIFGGRLAEYKYYDMAPIINQVFLYFKTL